MLVLRRSQIDHIGEDELLLIERLNRENIPASEISERKLEWLTELDVARSRVAWFLPSTKSS
ncbi:hypothetical protein C453_17259 [Haloferax elongans ATCC BAA-1513]|uniref:Uncharacterized protein n=1 Tax=Haloferax elongans ATCC BAA-1513 TaxID=1230453 RepID=M0HB53_HALEO|nr:hypothetical protein C453_17259 [Haloferax elongans ATCC BAA-1513]